MKCPAKEKRERDYLVQATLTVAQTAISDIPCEVFLPKRPTKKPLLRLKPTQEQFRKIVASREGSFDATVKGWDGEEELSISAPCVYFSRMEQRPWGPDLYECSLTGRPQHLQVIEYLGHKRESTRTHLILWISPNSMLLSAPDRRVSFTGDITYDHWDHTQFNICENVIMTIERHFTTLPSRAGGLRQWSDLTACGNIEVSAGEIVSYMKTFLPAFDGFLHIASLGSRVRTAWLGWSACDNNTVATFYRGDFAFPSGTKEPCYESLVHRTDFKEFMADSYSAYLRYPNREVIDMAIQAVVPGRHRTLEEAYLSMFSALEALVLDYRRRENIEFVVAGNQEWATLKKDLRSSIKKTIGNRLDKNRMSWMLGKLNELNRIPLQVAFDQFCEHHAIDIGDLWPPFRTGKICSLSDVRNHLIHGDPLVVKSPDALWVAYEHLRFTIERALLRMLSWPIDKSEVSKEFLRDNYSAMRMTADAQAELSKRLLDDPGANGGIP